MAGQPDDEGVERVSVEGQPAAWAIERASDLGVEPEEYLERVLVSVRAVEDGDPLDDLADARQVQVLSQRLDELDDEVDEKIADVRDRVIQVKRETDQKAPAGHEHDDLAAAVEEATERADTAVTQVEAIVETVNAIERRLDAGFDNYEEILSFLVDRTDDLADHTETVARALVDLRRRVQTIGANVERRETTGRLKRQANEAGVTEASCGACGDDVRIALLTDPECPFCGASFTELEPKSGFFGSATLVAGTAPALEDPDGASDADDVEADLETVIAEESSAGSDEAEDWLDEGPSGETVGAPPPSREGATDE